MNYKQLIDYRKNNKNEFIIKQPFKLNMKNNKLKTNIVINNKDYGILVVKRLEKFKSTILSLLLDKSFHYSVFPIPEEISGLNHKIFLIELFSRDFGVYISITTEELDGNTDYSLFMNPYGPALADISITSYCDMGCPYCYVDATTKRKDISIDDWRFLLGNLSDTVHQVAVGGGNPNQHLHFGQLLKIAYEEFGVVVNYTTNGRGLTPEVLKTTKKYCGAVAVSNHSDAKLFHDSIKKLISHGIKTNVHWVLGQHSYQTITAGLQTAIDTKKSLLDIEGLNAVIFLLNKPTGRSSVDNNLTKEQAKEFGKLFNDYMAMVETSDKTMCGIGFDACNAPLIVNHTDVPHDLFDTCDGGRFSFFADYDLQAYPCSFDQNEKLYWVDMKKKREILPDNEVLLSTWYDDKFESFRSKLNSSCPSCSVRSRCMGGCPILPDIVVCERTERAV